MCGAFNLKYGMWTLNLCAVLKLIMIKIPDITAIGDVSKLPDWYLCTSPGLSMGFLPTIPTPLM